jgi:hypothetical protein
LGSREASAFTASFGCDTITSDDESEEGESVIRPFDLRDVQLVYRLEGLGISLDSRTALIEARRPLWDAMLAYLIAGRGAPTFVLRQRGSGDTVRAFGQVRICSRRPQARLATVACSPGDHRDAVWERMLDALTALAGRHGAHMVLAQVPDDEPCFETLRRADFLVYTRQEVWRLTAPAARPEEERLRRERSADRWYVQGLIANTVPLLIQQIEPADPTGLGLVWLEDGAMMAYMCVHRGTQGHWIQLFLHPQVDRAAGSLIQEAAAHYVPTPEMPLYCCVRRYQEWLNRPLADLGFELLGSQAVMVRHTTARIAQPELSPAAVRDTGLEATSPVVHGSLKQKT